MRINCTGQDSGELVKSTSYSMTTNPNPKTIHPTPPTPLNFDTTETKDDNPSRQPPFKTLCELVPAYKDVITKLFPDECPGVVIDVNASGQSTIWSFSIATPTSHGHFMTCRAYRKTFQ